MFAFGFAMFIIIVVIIAAVTVHFTVPKPSHTCQHTLQSTIKRSLMQDSRPRSVAIGDFNNDTRQDIVVANSGTDTVGIFFGYSNGTFESQKTYSTGSGSQPYSVAVGDFNNDHWLDIAIANYGSNSIAILIADGNGTFLTAKRISLGSSRPVSISVADFNNDKRLDIVVASCDTSNVGIYRGYGNGSFAIHMTYSTGYDSCPYSVAVGDFNKDNRLDIAVANSGTSNVKVFLGYGNGYFRQQMTFTTGKYSMPYFVAAGDFNNDNRLDIAVANYGTGSIGVLLGNGNGMFSTVITCEIDSLSGPYSLAVGYFYNDKRLDIAVANSNNDTVVILRGLGNGTFVIKEKHSTGVGSNPLSVVAGYFDNDNRLDIAVANNDNNNIGVIIRSFINPFAIEITYPTGTISQPFNVATGDLNNDKKLDIVVANSYTSNVGVLLGYGDGTFKFQMNFSTGDYSVPYSVALGDFNRDYRLDVAVANSQTNNVGVLLGYGNGTFGTQTTYPTGNGSHSHSVAIGDFNNDNRLDIVVANWGSDNIGILLGYGDGNFAPPIMYSTGNDSCPIMVAVGDLNSDNLLDVVVVNLTTDNIGVLLGYGNGSFGNLSTYSNGCSPRSVVIRDFDNDSILDIAVANTQCNNVGILLGYGDGKFRDQMTYSTGFVTNTYWLGVGDFNEDDLLDIVAVNFDSSDLSVLYGYGNGSFFFGTAYSVGDSFRPSSIAVGDFNNDNLLDIAVSNYYACNIGIFLGDDDASDAIQTIYSTGSGSHPQSVIVADLNNDTKLDVVIINKGNASIGIRLGYGNGTFTNEMTYSVDSNFLPQHAALGDFNKDSIVDIVVANTLNDSVSTFLGYGNGSFWQHAVHEAGDGSRPYWIAVADFNNDSSLDLAITNSGTNSVSISLGYITVTFRLQRPSSTGLGVQPQFFAVADFNNDSRLDVVVADTANNEIGVHLGYGDGTFTAQTTYYTGYGSFPCFVAVGDFNNDNRLDIAVANTYADNIGVFLGYGDGRFATQIKYPTENGSLPLSIATGDFNSDNQLDAVVANYGTNNIHVFLGNGNGTFSNQTTYSTGNGSAPCFIAVGDFNGDNQLDVVVVNSGTNNIGIFCGYSNGTFATQILYSTGDGSSPYAVAIDDINGDNRLDVVVANSGTNNIGIFLGDGNGSFASQITYSTGYESFPTDVVIVDFNNDNRLDIVVANRNTSNVGVFFARDNGSFIDQITFPVGNKTYPIAVSVGDFNGDNQSDVVVLNVYPGNVVVLLASSTFFLSKATYQTGESSNPHSVTVGDFNNDQHLDMVIANYGTNNVAILLGYGDGTFESASIYSTGYGSCPYVVVVSDVNNDNLLDLIVANSGSNSVGLLFGNGNGTFSFVTTFSAGVASAPYSLVVSDFNNDNCSDIAVANYGINNLVVFFGNGNGTFGIERSYPLGYNAHPDSLAAGDFNKDGLLDIAVALDDADSIDVYLQIC